MSAISDPTKRVVGETTKAKYGAKEYEATVLMISENVADLTQRRKELLEDMKAKQHAFLTGLTNPAVPTTTAATSSKKRSLTSPAVPTTTTSSKKRSAANSTSRKAVTAGGEKKSKTAGKVQSTSATIAEKLEAQKLLFKRAVEDTEPCSSCASLKAENKRLKEQLDAAQQELGALKRDRTNLSQSSPFSVTITPKKVKLFEEMAALARRESGQIPSSSASVPSSRPKLKQVKLFGVDPAGRRSPSPPVIVTDTDEWDEDFHIPPPSPSPPRTSTVPTSLPSPSQPSTVPSSTLPSPSPTSQLPHRPAAPLPSASSEKTKPVSEKKMVELVEGSGVFLTENQLSFIRRTSKDPKDMLRKLLVALFKPQELAEGCAIGSRAAVNSLSPTPSRGLDPVKIDTIKDYVRRNFRSQDLTEAVLNSLINSKCATVRRGLKKDKSAI